MRSYIPFYKLWIHQTHGKYMARADWENCIKARLVCMNFIPLDCKAFRCPLQMTTMCFWSVNRRTSSIPFLGWRVVLNCLKWFISKGVASNTFKTFVDLGDKSQQNQATIVLLFHFTNSWWFEEREIMTSYIDDIVESKRSIYMRLRNPRAQGCS